MQKNILSWTGLAALVLILSGCVAAAPVMLAGAAGTGTANVAGSSVSMPQQMTDIKIKGQISGIANTLKMGNANIEATVFNGIVLLLGQVPTEEDNLVADLFLANFVNIVGTNFDNGEPIYNMETLLTRIKMSIAKDLDIG